MDQMGRHNLMYQMGHGYQTGRGLTHVNPWQWLGSVVVRTSL